jgi:hypothetical protein
MISTGIKFGCRKTALGRFLGNLTEMFPEIVWPDDDGENAFPEGKF